MVEGLPFTVSLAIMHVMAVACVALVVTARRIQTLGKEGVRLGAAEERELFYLVFNFFNAASVFPYALLWSLFPIFAGLTMAACIAAALFGAVTHATAVRHYRGNARERRDQK
jgi:hypothetical protein